jgi:hypothetical protein
VVLTLNADGSYQWSSTWSGCNTCVGGNGCCDSGTYTWAGATWSTAGATFKGSGANCSGMTTEACPGSAPMSHACVAPTLGGSVCTYSLSAGNTQVTFDGNCYFDEGNYMADVFTRM